MKNKKLLKALTLGAITCLGVGLFSGCEQLNIGEENSKIECSCNHKTCEHEPCTHEVCNHEKCTNQYVVYFHLNNGEDTIINFIKEGDTVDMDFFKDLTHHPKEYIEFDGWCTDSALKNNFDESTPITKNMNLYAKYKLKEGYNFIHIQTKSMEASNILQGDIVCYKEASETDEFEVGDVIVFHPTWGPNTISSHTVCHEIVEIVEVNENVIYKTKGSSNLTEDAWNLTREGILGKFVDVAVRNGHITDENLDKNYYAVNYNLNNKERNIIKLLPQGVPADSVEFKDLKHFKDYAEFGYWCTDSALQNKYDETTESPKVLDLYANWELKDGYDYIPVLTSSMEASGILQGDIVCYKKSLPTDSYQVGDVIIFHPTIGSAVSNNTVCHEIVEIVEDNGNVTYITKGSSNTTEDAWIVTPENILGKALDILMRDNKFVFIEIK